MKCENCDEQFKTKKSFISHLENEFYSARENYYSSEDEMYIAKGQLKELGIEIEV